MNERRIGNEVSPPTVDRQILHEMRITNGRYSKRMLYGDENASPPLEVYGWIMAIEDVTITSLTDNSLVNERNDLYDNTVIAAGTAIPGEFSNIIIASGKLLCFANTYTR